MAHLASQQFVAFFGVLAAGNIQKNAKHSAFDDAGIVTLAACGHPAHVVADYDPEVGLVAPFHVGALHLAVEQQPTWSDIPFVLLAGRQASRPIAAGAVKWRFPDGATNVVLLKRPLSRESLLPGMNGRQLAEIVRAHLPDLPILLITGYAENAAIRKGFLGTNMSMITKPFQIEGYPQRSARCSAEVDPSAR